MTDHKDLEAEIHPLKNDDRKSQDSPGNPAPKEPNPKPAAPAGLSRCRTVAFFLSLFAFLLAVFVVSFVIPCPDRLASGTTWSVSYNAAVAYDFLATSDINKDRIQDVLFLYKNSDGGSNVSLACAEEGFSSPCTFVAAASGANGTILWERPAAQNGALVECTGPQPRGGEAPAACILLGRPGPFIAVNLVTGETLWTHPNSFGGNTSILSPLLWVPDVDADGAPDLLVLTQEEKQVPPHLLLPKPPAHRPGRLTPSHVLQVNGYIYSGSTGQLVGPPGSLGVDGTSGAILHVTRTGAPYVLLPCESSLCGFSVKGLYEKATGRDSLLKTDPLWEDMLNATSHQLRLHSWGAVRYVMTIPGKAGEDLLLVTSEACMLLDGQDLAPRWTLGAAQIHRKPVLGHYKPDTLAVVIENGTGTDRQILLLDLSSGAILWSQALRGLPRDPQPASLPTADHRSAFFFWGLHEPAGANQTDPRAAPHSLYLFHPTLPGVLLELASISAHIVASRVVLLEPGRHAACILLTGPASPDVPGLVSVAKYKVQDLVPSSRVIHLVQGGPDSDQAVRNRFSRLRYRSEA